MGMWSEERRWKEKSSAAHSPAAGPVAAVSIAAFPASCSVVTELTFSATSYHLRSWEVKLDHGPLEQEVTLECYLHQPLLMTLRENEAQGKGRVHPWSHIRVI